MSLDPKQAPGIDDLDGKGAIYRLSGRYWLCENGSNAAILSVTIEQSNRTRYTWKYPVRLTSLPPGMDLKPKKATASTDIKEPDWAASRQFDFYLSSNKGAKPVFRENENLYLTIRTERDAWLYCFYTDSSGQMVQFLPNEQQNLSDPLRNFYKARQLHIFPNRQSFNLTINTETAGVELIKCLATSRDVTAELPIALQGRKFVAIPERYALRLRQLFEQLPNLELAERNLTITVLD